MTKVITKLEYSLVEGFRDEALWYCKPEFKVVHLKPPYVCKSGSIFGRDITSEKMWTGDVHGERTGQGGIRFSPSSEEVEEST